MPTDAAILELIQQAFATRLRPQHFTNYKHCEECSEHDELLRSRDVQSLRIEDVGNAGWDPICFISSEGFAYYFPALARLALSEPAAHGDWYASQLLFHLCSDGQRNERILACTVEQRRAVVVFLRHLVETRSNLADESLCADELVHAIKYWSDETLAP